MALTREEIEQIAKSSAQSVLEGLHRYAVDYKEPETIEQGLQDSMVEERTAADWYDKRAKHAGAHGDGQAQALYEFIANDEDNHYLLLNDRLQIQELAKQDNPVALEATPTTAPYSQEALTAFRQGQVRTAQDMSAHGGSISDIAKELKVSQQYVSELLVAKPIAIPKAESGIHPEVPAEFPLKVQAVIDSWRNRIAGGGTFAEAEARLDIIRAYAYKSSVGENDRAMRAIKAVLPAR